MDIRLLVAGALGDLSVIREIGESSQNPDLNSLKVLYRLVRSVGSRCDNLSPSEPPEHLHHLSQYRLVGRCC